MTTLRAKALLIFLGVGLTVGAYAALHAPGVQWYPHMDRECGPRVSVSPTHEIICGVDKRFVLPWRTREDPRSWPAGPHVVAIGDSFTFGPGVTEDQAWPARLGVINAGRFGANAADIADTVRRFLEPSPAAYTYTMPGWAPPIALESGRVSDPWPTEPTAFAYLVFPNDLLGSWEDGRTMRRGEDMRSFLERRYRERGPDTVAADFAAIVDEAGDVPVYASVAWYASDPEWWILDELERHLSDAGAIVLPRSLGMPLARDEFHYDQASHELVAARFREGVDDL